MDLFLGGHDPKDSDSLRIVNLSMDPKGLNIPIPNLLSTSWCQAEGPDTHFDAITCRGERRSDHLRQQPCLRRVLIPICQITDDRRWPHHSLEGTSQAQETSFHNVTFNPDGAFQRTFTDPGSQILLVLANKGPAGQHEEVQSRQQGNPNSCPKDVHCSCCTDLVQTFRQRASRDNHYV